MQNQKVLAIFFSGEILTIYGLRAPGYPAQLSQTFDEFWRHEQFVRLVLLMENQTGVHDFGNLSFSFNAGFQELTLHRVQIHRGKMVLEKLDPSKLKNIQPEPDLAGGLNWRDMGATLSPSGQPV